VADPAAFVQDADAKQAVAGGIAKVVGVPASYIAIFAKVRGRRLATAGDVQVDYTIRIPSTEASLKLSNIQATIDKGDKTLFTSAIQEQMKVSKGVGYTISVNFMSKAKVKTTTTTSTVSRTTVTATTRTKFREKCNYENNWKDCDYNYNEIIATTTTIGESNFATSRRQTLFCTALVLNILVNSAPSGR